MRKTNHILVVLVLPFFLLANLAFSQTDDPTKDQIPQHLRSINPPSIYVPYAVVTVGDYDNYIIGTTYAEGHISINPLNPLQMFTAWNITSGFGTQNGMDFSGLTPTFPNSAGDPVTAVDSLGNLYYETMKSPVSGCWVAKSTNFGQSWVYANVSAVSGNDKNWITADMTAGPYTNYVYSIMTSSGSASFWRSTDVGSTFSQTTSLTPHALPGAMVCVGPNGNTSGGCVYAVTHSGTNATGTYTFHLSTNGGVSFTTQSSVQWSNIIGTQLSGRSTVSGMRTRPYPMIAADNSWGPYRGRLYCVYASNEPAGDLHKSDIFLRYSTDKGITWSARVTVNDDVNTQNNQQFFPAIWNDQKTGKLYIKWYDSRNCASSDSMDVYATYTADGGQTFAQNQRITNELFKIKLSSSGGAPAYQGDYDAIMSNGKVSVPAWTDFRYNNYTSMIAYFPDFGMRLNPTIDSLNNTVGNITIQMQVPSVKLYTDTVVVSAVITPTPPTGSIAISYPSGNKLSTFPGNVPVKLLATGGVTPGTYTLEVTAKGPNGTPVHKRSATIVVGSSVTGVGNEVEVVNEFKLLQNYPNPFNPVTKIEYNLAKNTNVNLTIYNSIGKEVASFNYPNQQAGKHFAVFNAGNLSSGVYFYKIKADGFTDTKSMILLK